MDRTASRSKLPAKTASRSRSLRSSGRSASRLAATEPMLAGLAARGPSSAIQDVGSRVTRSSGSTAARSAARSMASGSPPRRRTSSATWGPVVASSVKPGRCRITWSTNRRTPEKLASSCGASISSGGVARGSRSSRGAAAATPKPGPGSSGPLDHTPRSGSSTSTDGEVLRSLSMPPMTTRRPSTATVASARRSKGAGSSCQPPEGSRRSSRSTVSCQVRRSPSSLHPPTTHSVSPRTTASWDERGAGSDGRVLQIEVSRSKASTVSSERRSAGVPSRLSACMPPIRTSLPSWTTSATLCALGPAPSRDHIPVSSSSRNSSPV